MKIHLRTSEMNNLLIVVTVFLAATLFQVSHGQNDQDGQLLDIQMLGTTTLINPTSQQLFYGGDALRDLHIVRVTSPSSAQLLISWETNSTLVSYFLLDLRVVNSTSIAPIIVYTTGSNRSKQVQGLKAGTHYNVSVKSYSASSVVLAADSVQSQTVPATPQITTGYGINSSEIAVAWSSQVGVDYYFLMVTLGTEVINQTQRGLNCSVAGLKPSSLYSFTLYAVNSAGSSAPSKRVTVLTLTPPPLDIKVTPLSSYSVALTWSSVDKALMYGIFIYEDAPTNNLLLIRKTTSVMIVLDNLQPCTKYVFGLTSYNWFYTSGEENRVLHKTGNLDQPRDVIMQYSSNMQSVRVSWTPVTGATMYTAKAESVHGHKVSCTNSSSSCEFKGLQCEQKYLVSVSAQIGSCISNESEPQILNTAPCAPQNVTVVRDCQLNNLNLYWNAIPDAVQYTAIALAPDGSIETCMNHDPNCFFLNLLCGTEYEMSVFAFNGKINGSTSQGIKTKTAPCDPDNVVATSNCQHPVMNVSWTKSPGAVSYVASAMGSSGHYYNCSSEGTSCQITGLQCGESLSVFVIAYDNECYSGSSGNQEVVTVPCTPKDISVMTDCGIRSTQVQWEYSEGAILYIAHATDKDGEEHTCQTFEQSCSFLDLTCGQMYTVSVTASNYQCESNHSQQVEIRTAPCIPKAVVTEVDCSQNSLLVTWTEEDGNVTYKATAQEDGAGYYNCTTLGNYCKISDITCGRLYSVSVQADDGHCISSSNWTTPFFSAPCKPTQVVANSICADGNVEMSWTKSLGSDVDMYIAAIQSSDQEQLTCQSAEEHCLIQAMKCGKEYTATVTAVSGSCQSLSSEIYMDPVPCSPIQLSERVTPGLVTLSWKDMPGALNYTTEITGVDGNKIEFHTSNTTYTLTELICGHKYNMSVTAIGRHCNSKPSDMHELQTAPCTPHNVMAHVDCISNTATISWHSSPGAESYTSEAIGSDGKIHVCNSTSTSCSLIGLTCGLSYLVTVSAANEKSKSEPSLPIEIKTAPCVPEQEPPELNCGKNTATLSWIRASGADSYIANVTAPGEELLSCHTENMNCVISQLKCGHIYSVTVAALNAQCRSQTSTPATLIMDPCTPLNVSANVDCESNTAAVSWGRVQNAENYTTEVLGADGMIHVCNSSSTSCDIIGLTCGHLYSVTVTAANENCKSEPSPKIEIQTAPCAPQQEPPQFNCNTKAASLSWKPASGAVNYTASVTAPGEEVLSCHTDDMTCIISDLKCGLQYSATVTAINAQCRSQTSTSASLITVPCQPHNVVAQMNCTNSVAHIIWDEALGAVRYTSTLSISGEEDLVCNSTELGCEVIGLRCGETYSVTVTAFSTQCASTPSSPVDLHSVPCVPSNVQAEVSCEANIATTSWAPAHGAVNYTAIVTGPQGEQYYCHEDDTLCKFPHLLCGLEYSATIASVGNTCSSEASAAFTFHTVPCLASDLHMQYQCGEDQAELSWAAAVGGVRYTATISTKDGQTLNCSTTATSCIVTGIKCGQAYTMAVEAFSSTCSSKATSTENFLTAPCVPEQGLPELNCDTNTASLSWGITLGADRYIVSVTGPEGEEFFYHTENLTCITRELKCGQIYSVNVTAINTQCRGQSSAPATLRTVPCQPRNVVAQMNCNNSLALVNWDEAPGALTYTSTFSTSGEEDHKCNSTELGCEVSSLQCGRIYSVTVVAFSDQCVSTPSSPVEIRSVPCVPSGVLAEVHCESNIATMSWADSQGAVSYIAEVNGPMEESYLYHTENTSWSTPQLSCGLEYNAIVIAVGDKCNSRKSEVTKIHTVPCIAKDLRMQYQCGANHAELSWGATLGGVRYTATISTEDRETVNCSTTGTSCAVNGLKCGKAYNMSVKTFSATCSSEATSPESFLTAPCVPEQEPPQINCETNTASLSWGITSGADSYIANLTAPGEEEHSCHTANMSCVTSELKCGQTYSVTVTAINAQCRSQTSAPATLATVPCQPQNVVGQLNCGTLVAHLTWDETPGALSYTSTLSTSGEEEKICNSTKLGCEVSGLQCEKDYNVTVTAFNNQCQSAPSPPVEVQPVPCMVTDLLMQYYCGEDHAELSWVVDFEGATYTANISTHDGETLSCNTNQTSCFVNGIDCGKTYTMTVETFSSRCNSKATSPQNFPTVPCVPVLESPQLNCDTNTALLSWGRTSGAVSYIANVTAPGKEALSCQTRDMSCTISNLTCGQTYTVTVTAINAQCQSQTSAPATLKTVPCQPQNLVAEINCVSSVAHLSWDEAPGALSYTSTLSTSGAVDLMCNRTELGCEISGLQCGRTYIVTVIAFSNQCKSTPSSPIQLHSVPCQPHNVVAQMNCTNSLALVSWDATPGALSYTSELSIFGEEDLVCNSTELGCEVRGLRCGETYSVTVTALNNHCKSTPSFPVQLHSVPCVPNQVQAQVSCISNLATVSWAVAHGALNYTALITGPQGEQFHCQEDNTLCNFTHLSCGFDYEATIFAVGNTCKSNASESVIIQTVPCQANNLKMQYQCGEDQAELSWTAALGGVRYIATITTKDGQTLNCSTTATTCVVMGIKCGQSYTMAVETFSATCSSKATSTENFLTAPCVPEQKPPELYCETNTALLSWGETQGADHYIANVTAPGLEELSCHTENMSCLISELKCGQIYTLTVTAINAQCRSQPSAPATLITAPCQPLNVVGQLNCTSLHAHVSWDAAPGALNYTSTLRKPGEEDLRCSSTGLDCEINGLKCGQTYHLTVTAINTQCESTHSSPVELHSAPCQPQNVVAQMNCTSSVAQMSWDEAPGALRYASTLSTSGKADLICNSIKMGCEVSDLQCGETYSVTVTAFSNECESMPSSPVQLQTVPCVPRNVQAEVSCESNIATTSWAAAPGAVNYTAIVTGPQGVQYYCHEDDTLCTFPHLLCGLEYNTTITSVGNTCSSDASTAIQFYTVPCLASDLKMLFQCGADHAELSWGSALGGVMYTATISTTDGQSLKCNSTETSCVVTGIKCGQTYTMTVETFSATCSSKATSKENFPTDPCVPQNVIAEIDCQDNSALLSWSRTPGALNYTVVVSKPNGEENTFHTMSTTYDITDLDCGATYYANVKAFNAQCQGENSTVIQLVTAPCPPDSVLADVDCVTGSVALSWHHMSGAEKFTSYLIARDGHNETCISTQTNCTFLSLPCGQEYTATVTAANNQCIGQGSEAVMVHTVPCIPHITDYSLMCTDNSLLVFWNPSSGATAYSTSAVGKHGHVLTAITVEPNSLISTLQCGEVYNLTVLAKNNQCHSAESPAMQISSGPCTPMQLVAMPYCAINGAVASWESSTGAISYQAVFKGEDGHQTSCNTTDTSCTVPGLNCGQVYIVTVTAFDGNCQSLATNISQMTTAPCEPTNVKAEMDCAADLINVTWSHSRGAVSYVTTAKAKDGHTLTCNTTTNGCVINNILCGKIYSISVTAQSMDCSSDIVIVGDVETVPCTPGPVSVEIDCFTSEALVSWQENNIHETNYTAVAYSTSGDEWSCSSTFSSCRIRDLECGLEYIFKVQASNRKCSSVQTEEYKTKTAPCQPQGLRETLKCDTNDVSLLWSKSKGAKYYLVTLYGNGTTLYHNTSDVNCMFPALPCGQVYNVSVKAMDDKCSSVLSSIDMFKTAPCVPTIVTNKLNCATNVVFISWTSSAGATDYHVKAIAAEGLVESSCNSTENNCLLTDLQCGMSYNIQMVALDHRCSSDVSAPVLIDTAPCVPQDAEVLMDCKNNSATFTWKGSRGALSYLAEVNQDELFVHSCNKAETVCTVSDLSCGTIYSFSVLANNIQCNSSFTAPIKSGVVPCPPDEVETSPYKSNAKPQEVHVSWKRSHCATEYMATVHGEIEDDPGSLFTLNSYWTSYMDFYIPVPCGSFYNVTVTARNPAGESIPSVPAEGFTAPCSPKAKATVVTGEFLLISWEASVHAKQYRVEETDNNTTVCRTEGLSCEIAFTHNTFKVFAVNLAGESEPTIVKG